MPVSRWEKSLFHCHTVPRQSGLARRCDVDDKWKVGREKFCYLQDFHSNQRSRRIKPVIRQNFKSSIIDLNIRPSIIHPFMHLCLKPTWCKISSLWSHWADSFIIHPIIRLFVYLPTVQPSFPPSPCSPQWFVAGRRCGTWREATQARGKNMQTQSHAERRRALSHHAALPNRQSASQNCQPEHPAKTRAAAGSGCSCALRSVPRCWKLSEYKCCWRAPCWWTQSRRTSCSAAAFLFTSSTFFFFFIPRVKQSILNSQLFLCSHSLHS